MSKKNKKVKGRTLDLTDFLSEGGSNVQAGFTVVQKKVDWSDDSVGVDIGPIVLPTAPIASRGGLVDESKVPTERPFVAFLGNLPFEIVEEEVAAFFNDLKLTSVRFVRDSAERFRGFGYAEFEDRPSLIEALGYDGEQLRNREIRVGLPNDNEGDYRGGFGRDRGRQGGFGSRGDRTEHELPNDWRAAARDEQSNRGFESYNRSDRYGGRDGGGFGGDRGGTESRDWRDRGSESRSFGRHESVRDRNDTPSSTLAERPKLKIAPRTKPLHPIKVTPTEGETSEKKPSEKPKVEKPKAADIFGAAKPVDTAAKMEEIEKRIEAKQKEELAKSRQAEKVNAEQKDQQQQSSSKEPSPQHESSNIEQPKKWRDEIRDEKEKKEGKPRSEKRAPAQVLEEAPFVATSKNKYADLEVSDNQVESDAENEIRAEN